MSGAGRAGDYLQRRWLTPDKSDSASMADIQTYHRWGMLQPNS